VQVLSLNQVYFSQLWQPYQQRNEGIHKWQFEADSCRRWFFQVFCRAMLSKSAQVLYTSSKGSNFPVCAKYTWMFLTRNCAKTNYVHLEQEGLACLWGTKDICYGKWNKLCCEQTHIRPAWLICRWLVGYNWVFTETCVPFDKKCFRFFHETARNFEKVRALHFRCNWL